MPWQLDQPNTLDVVGHALDFLLVLGTHQLQVFLVLLDNVECRKEVKTCCGDEKSEYGKEMGGMGGMGEEERCGAGRDGGGKWLC